MNCLMMNSFNAFFNCSGVLLEIGFSGAEAKSLAKLITLL